MKPFIRSIPLVSAVCAFLFFNGCVTVPPTKAPYAVTADCRFAGAANSYEYLGVDFTFFNAADKPVREFTLVFYVYDEIGASPLPGSNCIVTDCTQTVAPQAEYSGEIGLDDFDAVPETSYILDRVYVSRICYADGSVWEDRIGRYAQ